MTVISDISDEPKFTIKVVSQQTGILPVTLRAWERRYEILSPQRGENRYRLYSERDITILRWLKDRVDGGVPISSAALELRAMNRSGQWMDVIQPPMVKEDRGQRVSDQPPAYYSKALYRVLVQHDEEKSNRLLKEVNESFDLLTALTKVIIPTLVQVGDAWYRGEIRVTTEHFASSYIRGKLLALLQTFPTRRSYPPILIGSGPGEQHEIGGLMVAVLLRKDGYRVEYLGPDLPLVDLADYAGYIKPAMVVLTATMEESAIELSRLTPLLKKLTSPPVFGFGGFAFNQNPRLRESIDGEFLGETIEKALQTIQLLVGAKKPRPA